MEKKTLVLGASDNPSRYSYLVIQRLRNHKHPVVAIGRKHAVVADVTIETEMKAIDNIDTVTMYLNPFHQQEYYNYPLAELIRQCMFNSADRLVVYKLV